MVMAINRMFKSRINRFSNNDIFCQTTLRLEMTPRPLFAVDRSGYFSSDQESGFIGPKFTNRRRYAKG
jgi:hypothetical protein